MEEEITVEETIVVSNRFPTLKSLGYDLISAILSLFVVLLPGIARYVAAGDSELQQPFSPEFQLVTLLLALGLSVYAIVKSETGSGTRVIALVALVACTIRLVLVG